MPLTPVSPTSLTQSPLPLPLPRTPSLPLPLPLPLPSKRVAFSLAQHPNSTIETPPLPTAIYHRFRRLDSLLQPSPALPFPPRQPLPHRSDARPLPPSRSARAQDDKENHHLPSHTPGGVKNALKPTSSIAVQTSPITRRPQGNTPPAMATQTSFVASQTSFVASLRSPPMDTAVGNQQDGARDVETMREEKPLSPHPTATRSPPSPSEPPAASTSPLQPPPAVSPRHATPIRTSARLPSSRSTHPSPAAEPVDRPSPSPTSPPPSKTAHPTLSTANLSPFRYFLSSSSRTSRSTSSPPSASSPAHIPPGSNNTDGGATKGVWIELLSHGGDVLLDSRAKDGRVWVVSSGADPDGGVGSSISLFRPSSMSAPLVLLHPLAVLRASGLFANKQAQGEGMDGEVKAAQKAWKKVEKVLKVVRSRTVLLSFPHLLPPFPPTLTSPIQAKITIFSDSPCSYSLSTSLTTSPASSIAVSVYVSTSRDVLVVTLPSSPSAGAAPTSNRWTHRLSTFCASSDSSSARQSFRNFVSSATRGSHSPSSSTSSFAVEALIDYALSPTFSSLIARARDAHLSALSTPSPVPPSHLARIPSPLSTPKAPRRKSTTSLLAETPIAPPVSSIEARLIIPFLSAYFSLPPPLPDPQSPSRLPGASLPFPEKVDGSDERAEQRRCLPGLGWVVRSVRPQAAATQGNRAGEEGEDSEGAVGGARRGEGEGKGREYSWEVLFGDGERVVARATTRVMRRVGVDRGRGDGEREREGGEELQRLHEEFLVSVEVEDWKGRRYALLSPPPSSPSPPFPVSSQLPPHPPITAAGDVEAGPIPARTRKRMGLVVELLGLF